MAILGKDTYLVVPDTAEANIVTLGMLKDNSELANPHMVVEGSLMEEAANSLNLGKQNLMDSLDWQHRDYNNLVTRLGSLIQRGFSMLGSPHLSSPQS